MQAELDAINASLARINSLVSTQKKASARYDDQMLESQGVSDISMELKGPKVPRVSDDVGTKVFHSM